MIGGRVTDEGEPIIWIHIGGRNWPATVDTGLNGDLQLPQECRQLIDTSYAGRSTWILADNTRLEEDVYLANVEFDEGQVPAIVSFQRAENILIGTHFIRAYRLTIDFVQKTALLERAHPS